MKKQILITAVLLSSLVTIAQETSKRFQFGVRSGLNISSIVGEDDDFESPDARFGVYAGLVMEARINDRFSVLAEGTYSQQGFEVGESIDDDDFDPQFQVDYIQVPVLVKVNIFKGLSAHAGPQVGFKISEQYDTDIFGNDGETETDVFDDIDFQLVTGAQYTFDFGLFAQARYSFGLSEVIEDTEIHNSVFSIGAGFMF